MNKDQFNSIGVSLIDAIVAAGFAKTKSEARRLIESGAIRINDQKVTNITTRIFRDDSGIGLVHHDHD